MTVLCARSCDYKTDIPLKGLPKYFHTQWSIFTMYADELNKVSDVKKPSSNTLLEFLMNTFSTFINVQFPMVQFCMLTSVEYFNFNVKKAA